MLSRILAKLFFADFRRQTQIRRIWRLFGGLESNSQTSWQPIYHNISKPGSCL